MLRSHWLHTLFGLARSRNQRRRQEAQRRRPVRLTLETLEARVNPAPIITLQAATASQLQSDIATANTNPTQQYDIQLTGTSPYNLTTQLNVTNTAGVTIESSNGIVLNAATNSRIFSVSSGAKLTLKDLTLQGGNVTATSTKGGGAIKDVGGSVTLSAVTVQNNVVHGSAQSPTIWGGGIFVAGKGVLSILGNSTITNNQALGLGGAVSGTASGGGIYASGSSTVTISNSTISNNLAQGGNLSAKGSALVGAQAGAAYGGGVYLSGSSLTITGTSLTGNKTQGGNAVNSSPTTVVSTKATSASGGDAFGGAVYVSGTGWSASITGSQLSNNTATGGNGAAGPQGANGSGTNAVGLAGDTGGQGGTAEGGAAFFSRNGTSLTITSSSFASNGAKSGNGGTGGQGGTGTGSAAGGAGGTGGQGGEAVGGAVFISSGGTPITVLNSSFTNNTALGGNGANGGTGGNGGPTGAGGVGGAAGSASVQPIEGGGMVVFGGNLTMLNTTLGHNTAQGGNSGTGGTGGVAGGGTHAANGGSGLFGVGQGGGVYDALGGAASPNWINDTIAFNQALSGTVGNTPTNFSGGGGLWAGSAAVLTNTMLESNQTSGSSGSDIFVLAGSIGSSSSNDFISNTSSLSTNTVQALTSNNSILNNSTAQLGTLATTTGGLAYYPLLANSLAIDAGANSALSAIATAEGVSTSQATDEIGNPRTTSSDTVTDIGAIELNPASIKVTLSFSPPSITIPTGTTSVGVTVTVTDSSGNPINGTNASGSVAFTVLNSSNSPVGASTTATVSSTGQAATSLSLPANLAAGSYTVRAQFTSSNGTYAAATNTESLTVTSSPTPAPVTVSAGNGTATFSTASQTVSITVGVSSTSTVNKGSVTVTLLNNGSQLATGTGTVSAGQTIVMLAIPGGLPVGTYTLTETYTDSSQEFASNSASGTLTIHPSSSPSPSPSPTPNPSPSPSPPPTQFQAAFTIAVDVAALLLQGNPFGLAVVSQFSQQFIQKPLPPASELMSEIFADFSFAGGLAPGAVQLGFSLAQFVEFTTPGGGSVGGAVSTRSLVI